MLDRVEEVEGRKVAGETEVVGGVKVAGETEVVGRVKVAGETEVVGRVKLVGGASEFATTRSAVNYKMLYTCHEPRYRILTEGSTDDVGIHTIGAYMSAFSMKLGSLQCSSRYANQLEASWYPSDSSSESLSKVS